jgi:uncharacterized protein
MGVKMFNVESKPWSCHGFGLGFRSCHYRQILNERPSQLDWLEVITENFMGVGGRPRTILEAARETYPIAFHGVGLSIGSFEDPSKDYLWKLKNLVDEINPFLISDHLSFSHHKRHNSHDLLPIAYTTDNLQRISDRVNRIQDLLGRRFMLENPSAYVSYAHHDFSEVDFLCALIHKTGMGVLLDVNNLCVNQLNLNLDPWGYIKTLPDGAVGQIHVAGHSVVETDLGIVRIDTHDQPILPVTFDLAKEAMARFPDASVMIEWDDHIPPLGELLGQLDKLRSLRVPGTLSFSGSTLELSGVDRKGSRAPIEATNTAFEQESNLFSLAVQEDAIQATDQRLLSFCNDMPVPRFLGARVYKNAYFARLHEVLKKESELLAAVTTDEGFETIAAYYFREHPPRSNSINGVGRQLSQFLKTAAIESFDFGVPMAVLSEIAQYDFMMQELFSMADPRRLMTVDDLSTLQADDWETLQVYGSGLGQLHEFNYDILGLAAQIARQESPCPPDDVLQLVLFFRKDGTVQSRQLETWQFCFLKDLMSGKCLLDAVSGAWPDGISEGASRMAILFLTECIQWGLFSAKLFSAKLEGVSQQHMDSVIHRSSPSTKVADLGQFVGS